jgi:hypothetical protein
MTNRKNAFYAICLLIEIHLFTFLQEENLNCFLPQLISDLLFYFRLNWTSALKRMDFISTYFKFDY